MCAGKRLLCNFALQRTQLTLPSGLAYRRLKRSRAFVSAFGDGLSPWRFETKAEETFGPFHTLGRFLGAFGIDFDLIKPNSISCCRIVFIAG